jgi:hypothetical protein
MFQICNIGIASPQLALHPATCNRSCTPSAVPATFSLTISLAA